MFVKKCFSCGSSSVNVLKSTNGWRSLHQFCSKCGIDQTALVLKSRQTRKTAPKRKKTPPSPLYPIVIGFWLVSSLIAHAYSAPTLTYTREITPQIDHFGKVNEMVDLPEKSMQTYAEKPETMHIETIEEKIERIAGEYGLDAKKMYAIVNCESRLDTKAHNKTKREDSWGLSQINLLAHDVTIQQATNPDFALKFLADHWGKRASMWVHCSKGT